MSPQLPHYVLAKNTRSGSEIESSSVGSGIDHSDDLFDPLYESDEIDDEEYIADYRHDGINSKCYSLGLRNLPMYCALLSPRQRRKHLS